MAYNRMTRGRRMPSSARFALRRMPTGSEYLGEDATYYYFVEPGANPSLNGFDIGNMFKRMIKFTPKSFTPGNIYKGFINSTLTVATGGLYQVLPKNLKKTVYEVGKVAVPVIAGGVLAYTAGPAVMGMLMPKLRAAGSLLGIGSKAAGSAGGDVIGAATGQGGSSFLNSGLSVGGKLIDLLGKMSPVGQSTVASSITPEQIAQWEQHGSIPTSLVPLIEQALQQSLPPMSGNASLYDPSSMAAREMQLAQKGEESVDWSSVMMIGLPAIAGLYFLARR